MKHDEKRRNQALLYYYGELAEREREDFESHSRDCGDCASLLRDLGRSESLMREAGLVPEAPAPARAAAGLWSRLDRAFAWGPTGLAFGLAAAGLAFNFSALSQRRNSPIEERGLEARLDGFDSGLLAVESGGVDEKLDSLEQSMLDLESDMGNI